MCGRYELTTEFQNLPAILKKDQPNGFSKNYAQQQLIRPTNPVIVLKNEGKVSTTLMFWGFISEWSKAPFESSTPKPFNARAETVKEKKLFRGSWRHKRCVLPANGFFEKGYRIRRKDSQPFWLAGIWNKWMSPEGSELESCCVLTTKANNLVSPLHNRMPVIIPNRVLNEWIEPVKDSEELRALEPILKGWTSNEWVTESLVGPTNYHQINLF